jgi:adenylate kinase family enzyme
VCVCVCVSRWIHPGSGRIYSYSYKPPKQVGVDDETGEPLEQREDDQPEAMRKRLKIYDDMTEPLIQYYSQQPGEILKTFVGTMSDVIYPHVKRWLESKHCS